MQSPSGFLGPAKHPHPCKKKILQNDRYGFPLPPYAWTSSTVTKFPKEMTQWLSKKLFFFCHVEWNETSHWSKTI